MKFALLFSCLVSVILLTATGAAQTVQKFEDFSHDPGWLGVQNRIPVNFPTRVLQAFGWNKSNFSGDEAGEIGGYITNSVRPAYYGKILAEPKTLDDPLEMSGSFAVMEQRSIMSFHTSSDCYIGFFNESGQGWRGKNILGIRLNGMNEPNGCFVQLLYSTSVSAASGLFLLKDPEAKSPGKVRDLKSTEVFRIAPDGKRHFFVLKYDPRGGETGSGLIHLRIDQVEWSLAVPPAHRKYNAVFNRCGIFNEQQPGRAMVIYLDDVTINGELEAFSADPHWEGRGNDTWFDDDMPYGSQNFGYSETSHAGGAKGEVGGTIWRSDETEKQLASTYADDVGPLSFNDRLEARGKIAIPMFSTDSGVCIGWFGEHSEGWFPAPFIGVNLDSYTTNPRLFMPMYGAGEEKQGAIKPPQESPWFSYGPEVHEFSIVYDPDAAEGMGAITVTFDDQQATLNLKQGVKEQGGTLNRFGLMNMQRGNGKYSQIYLDDLYYTAKKPKK